MTPSTLLLPLLLGVGAQQANPPTTAAASAPPPAIDCKDAAHRAIGFWVGEWTVVDTASSKPVARSRIEWILGGCAIRESYAQTIGPGGQKLDYQGSSQTALDDARGQWRQFYIDSTGNTSDFTGELRDGKLVMRSEKNGGTNRMTIEALPDGSVRQRGERSVDGGRTWTPGYDFTYVRRP